MLRLWNRLVTLDIGRLTQHVFVNDFYMAQENTSNWCFRIWEILNKLGQEEVFYNRSTCDLKLCEQGLYKLQEDKWRRTLLQEPKLRFYRLFKSKLEVEDYVQYNL